METKLIKSVYITQQELSGHPKFKYCCPMVEFDKNSRKWRCDLWYFNDKEVARKAAKQQNYRVL